MRLQLQQTIDNSMQKHIDEERKKWKAILESVVDVIFLNKRNLPFREHREAFESSNQGNFLETVKLLAKYSPVLSKHLSDIRISKKMTTTYLSPTIQNKLVLLLSNKVKNIVLQDVREAKYFGIMCDSTPQWRMQDFSMGGVSVTSHLDDVKMLHYNYSSLEVLKCIVL